MKTTIQSNGKQVDIIFEAENKFEEGIIDSTDLFKAHAEVYKDDNKKLHIHIDTEINIDFNNVC